MFKKIIIILFLIPLFSISNAEIVKKIVIEGNKRVSEETIKIYGDINLDKDLSENDLNNILNKLYSTNFFENIEINLEKNILKVSVKEYPVINQLIINGEEKISYREQIKKLIKLKEKKAFIKPFLSQDIETIKTLYSSLGYNFANIEVKFKEIDAENLDILFNIERGEQTKISSIKFIGNKTIRSKRLRDVIASEEDKFWKIISKNTNLNENLINFDKRLLSNYYKSIGYYDIKVSSNIAQLNQKGNADLIYTIDEGTRYTINKISRKSTKFLIKTCSFR